MWRAGIAIVLLLSSCTTTATQPQSSANTANTPAPITPPPSAWTDVSPKIRINRVDCAVEFEAVSVITTGFLESYVCTVGTREHESLFAFDGKASEIHAAMLLAGFVPGAPGRWREVAAAGGSVAAAGGSFSVESVAPSGNAVRVTIRLPDGHEFPIDHFARIAPIDATTAANPAPARFVFGGSRFQTDRKSGRERYLADGSGSLIGLVTFGDETIGAAEVIPDQAGVATPTWEVFSERMPTPGTRVTIMVNRIP